MSQATLYKRGLADLQILAQQISLRFGADQHRRGRLWVRGEYLFL